MKINYSGKKVSLLTKHGKEKIIVPIIERNLGCRIELIQSFDTDELGTFDGTIEQQSQKSPHSLSHKWLTQQPHQSQQALFEV